MPAPSSLSEPSLYYYNPSIPAAIIGALSFVGLATLYLWLFVRYQAWHFWAMYIGLFMECIGYMARLVSVYNTSSVYPFIVSYLALLLAPSFMAAACYATFGRLLWWVTPPESHNVRTLWCSARFVTPFFIAFDIGSFLIQLLGAGAVGAAYTSKTLIAGDRQEKIRTGFAALRVGFVSQLICFGLFIFIGIRFLYVSRRWAGRPLRYLPPKGANWTRLNWAVNVATVAITIRAAYRMVEFSNSSKNPGYLIRNEWPFWVCDALPMMGVFIILAFIYPGQYLPHEFLGWWLNTRRLRNQVKSSPPNYNQAVVCAASEQSRSAIQQA